MATEKNEIQNIVEEVLEQDSTKYPLKLTWKQIWIALTMIGVVAGGIFNAGVVSERKLADIDKSKVEAQHQTNIKQLTIEKDAALLDVAFYKERYEKTNARLRSCMDDWKVLTSINEIIEK